MDWYATAADMAGVPLPSDRTYDGVSLKGVLQTGSMIDR